MSSEHSQTSFEKYGCPACVNGNAGDVHDPECPKRGPLVPPVAPAVDTLSEIERVIWASAFAAAYVERGDDGYYLPWNSARAAVLSYRKRLKTNPWAGVRL